MGLDGRMELQVWDFNEDWEPGTDLKSAGGRSTWRPIAAYAARWKIDRKQPVTMLDASTGEVVVDVPAEVTSARLSTTIVEVRGPSFCQRLEVDHPLFLCRGISSTISARGRRSSVASYVGRCLEDDYQQYGAGDLLTDEVYDGFLAFGLEESDHRYRPRHVPVVDCEAWGRIYCGPLYRVRPQLVRDQLLVRCDGSVSVVCGSSR